MKDQLEFDSEEVLNFALRVLSMPPNQAIAYLEKAFGRDKAQQNYEALKISPAAKILREQGRLP